RTAGPTHGHVRQLREAGTMLRAGIEVATNKGRVIDVGPVDHRRMGERGIAPPVLRRGVDEDQFRRFGRRRYPLDEAVAGAGAGILLGEVGVGELVAEAGCRLHGRLGTAMVELAAPTATDKPERAVDSPRPGLVGVEAEIQEMADKA